MNILHVEDEIDWFERIVRPALNGIGAKSVSHAISYSKAIEIINSKNIDYIILDLAIPLDDENPTSDISNGLKLASYIRVNYPGTPLLILTGQQTEEAVEQFVEDEEVTIFWNGKARSLVKVRPKRSLDKVIDLLKEAVEELAAIDSIEIDAIDCELDELEQRVIRLFCKHNEAIAARIYTLDGLSDAKVLRVNLINGLDKEFHWALAKIDTKVNIDIEDSNFNLYVNKLPVGSFPNLLNQYSAGCANKKGIFYQFAAKYNSDYFEILFNNEDIALQVLERIRAILDTWCNNKQVKQIQISDIRRKLCSDFKFNSLGDTLNDFNLDVFERKISNTNSCIQHGDLHGKNILVSEEYSPIIIDYGDIKEASSVLDIVTLELSPYFHPATSGKVSPPIELFENWFDEDIHLSLSPFPKVSEFLREWKNNNSFMAREYIVTVYAYAVRQLTYEGTNKSFALALIKSATSVYN